MPTNGDGFGLGWYVPSIAPEPALFTSISPAWSDTNLLNLTAKIKSSVFFAHIRAASAGGVTQFNCHPFVYGPWMLMHNGCIADFVQVKRHLRRLLDDDIYNWIKGDTDSEHLFALFLQLAKGRDLEDIQTVAEVLQEALQEALRLSRSFNSEATSYFNVCITDGRRLLASRYCSDPKIIPETMHYSIGNYLIKRPVNAEDDPMMSQVGSQHCILVSSEKLSNVDSEWHDVLPNHLLMIDIDFKISMRALALV